MLVTNVHPGRPPPRVQTRYVCVPLPLMFSDRLRSENNNVRLHVCFRFLASAAVWILNSRLDFGQISIFLRVCGVLLKNE